MVSCRTSARLRFGSLIDAVFAAKKITKPFVLIGSRRIFYKRIAPPSPGFSRKRQGFYQEMTVRMGCAAYASAVAAAFAF